MHLRLWIVSIALAATSLSFAQGHYSSSAALAVARAKFYGTPVGSPHLTGNLWVVRVRGAKGTREVFVDKNGKIVRTSAWFSPRRTAPRRDAHLPKGVAKGYFEHHKQGFDEHHKQGLTKHPKDHDDGTRSESRRAGKGDHDRDDQNQGHGNHGHGR